MRGLASLYCLVLIGCASDGAAELGLDAAAGSSSAAVTSTITCNGSEVHGPVELALAAGNSIVFTAGICQVTGPLVVTHDSVTIEGAGPSTTRIKFIPTANNQALFIFEDPAANPEDRILENVALKNVGLQSGTSFDQSKTAVYVHDARNFLLENVAIGPWDAATATKQTTGIEVRGREAITFRKLDVLADLPIRIGANVNEDVPGQYRDAAKDLQHGHFQDVSLQSNTKPEPVVKIQAGTVLRNVTFDGYQSWTGGGLVWLDGTEVDRQPSTHLQIANLQVAGICTGLCTDEWAIRIVKNSTRPLADLLVELSITATRGLGTPTGPGWRGIKASGVTRTVLRQVVHEGRPETQPANVITPAPYQDP